MAFGQLALAATDHAPSDRSKGAIGQTASTPRQEATPEKDRRATRDQPAIVELVKPPVIQVETIDKTEKHRDYLDHEWWLVYLTAALAAITFGLAAYTAKLYRATVTLGKDAKTTGDAHATRMQASVAEAVRSANAMEAVDEATRNNALLMQGVMQKQMRAYISVTLGNVIYQDARCIFQADAILTNTGFTPAKQVSYVITAEVLDAPVPEQHTFIDASLTKSNDASIAPRQNLSIPGPTKGRLPDADAEKAMRGIDKRLYVWGTVRYVDVFDNCWYTNFAFGVQFVRLKDVEGEPRYQINFIYHPKHNDST